MNSKPSDQAAEERTRKGSVTSQSSLGERLRLAREARGISLRQISEQTRIQMRYLEGIEADDYKRLPGGIFNRSFIKAYAKAVNFDETEALNAYARTVREKDDGSPDDAPIVSRPSRVYTNGDKDRSPILTVLLTIAILVVLTLGIYAALHWYQKRSDNNLAQTQPAATNTAVVTQQSLPPEPSQSATTDFQIQVTARGEAVWIRSRIDDGSSTETTLAPNEEARFTPERRLSIQYARSKATALLVTINGRPARVPVVSTSARNTVEMIIDENYEQLLQ